MTIRFSALIAAGLLMSSAASAHILLEGKQAAVGADYKAVFVVPHGCAGSATIKLRVQIPEGIKEVAWSGGKAPDKTREEFVIQTFLTNGLKPDTTLYFPVVQECEQGISRWIEISRDGGTHSHEGKWPAPGVKLAPKP